MSDDLIRNSLRRALRPVPGDFADRMTDHARRVARGEVEPLLPRVSVRTIVGSVAIAAVFAAGGLVILSHRTASHLNGPPSSASTLPAVAAGSPSANSSQPSGVPVASSTAAAASSATASAVTSPTASPTAYPDCQSGDLSGTLNTGSTYAVGQKVPVQLTITNRSSRACRLPTWCDYEWRALNAQGQRVDGSPMIDCVNPPPSDVLMAGQSKASSASEWDTARLSGGTYTVSADLNGFASVSVRVTLAGSPATPTAAPPTPTPTATPILP